MTDTSFKKYLAGAEAYYQEHKQHLRKGQAYMNYLGEVNIDMYPAVSWDLDPFYQDKFIPAFLQWVEEGFSLRDFVNND